MYVMHIRCVCMMMWMQLLLGIQQLLDNPNIKDHAQEAASTCFKSARFAFLSGVASAVWFMLTFTLYMQSLSAICIYAYFLRKNDHVLENGGLFPRKGAFLRKRVISFRGNWSCFWIGKLPLPLPGDPLLLRYEYHYFTVKPQSENHENLAKEREKKKM